MKTKPRLLRVLLSILFCALYSFFKGPKEQARFWRYSENKNSLNIFPCLRNAGKIVSVIHRKEWALIFVYAWIIVIFVPCLVECSQFITCQEKPESIDCHLVFEKGRFEEWLKFEIVTRKLESGKFGLECFPQFDSSKASVFILRTKDSKNMRTIDSSQGTGDSKAASNKSQDIWTDIYNWLIVLSGGFGGIAIVMIGYRLWHREHVPVIC